MLFKLIYYPCIIEYRKLTETVETELRKLENIEEKRVEAAKKNLKQLNIGNYLETFMNIVLTGSSNVQEPID